MKKVMKIFMMLLILSTVSSLTFSMSKAKKEEIINQIRADYKKTNENSKNYKVREVKVKSSHKTHFLSVGDSVRFYTENGKLRKIITFTNQNDGKTVMEYYIKNGKPYFIAETVTEIDGKKLEPPMMTRYYFAPDELIRVTHAGAINDDHELGETAADIMQVYYEIKDIK